MNLQGKWIGTITYGKEYRKNTSKELCFEMEIFQNSHQIKATAIDIEGFGMSPDPANIEGTFIDHKIQFVKQYGSFHHHHNGKTKIDPSRPGSKISYTGTYDTEKDECSGTWILRDQVKLLGIIPIKFVNTGKWTMQRK